MSADRRSIDLDNGQLHVGVDVAAQTVTLSISHEQLVATVSIVLERDTAFEALEKLHEACAELLAAKGRPS